MKPQHMFKYFISTFLLLFATTVIAQEQKKDSTDFKTPYGLRIGIDISKPIIGAIDKGYSGLELVADYRITKNFYIAAEFGHEENSFTEDYFKASAKGTYTKIGFNYNAYKNWLNMTNEIFVGLRYGFGNFDQTLNEYTINTGSEYFTNTAISVPNKASGLTAHWSEFVFGLKAEAFNNIYLGFSVSYKIMLSVKDPTNFKTLYVPGFNTVYESGTGFGFNYTIMYTIPFFKK